MIKSYNVIGLMSGTSLDGLDMVYTQVFKDEQQWNFKIQNTKSITYSKTFASTLKNAINLKAEELLMLHNSYGSWLGKQVHTFIEEENLKPNLIASHGHTVFHQPEKGFTLQIGSGQHIANACGIKVVCDFRSNDVTLGGQGAPFVPIGDKYFFRKYEFCLNLGGISNFSFELNNQRKAYDIAPANMLLNYIANKINKNYDHNGELARQGTLNKTLLKQLNNLEYYQTPFPKSLGYEWFTENIVPIIERTNDSVNNLLYTCTAHIAQQIAANIKMISSQPNNQLLVTGGGAKNGFLLQKLQENLKNNAKIIVPSEELIDFKEALIFALMGVLRIENQVNVLASVTGASKDSSSGVVYEPA